MRPSTSISSLLFLLCVLAGGGVGIALYDPAHPAPLIVGVGAGFIFGVLVASSVKVVAQWERMLVLRLGRFHASCEPGMRFIVPVFDTPIFIEMRLQTINIAQQQTITQDNVPAEVNGVIFFKVLDARVAALEVENYRAAMLGLAQGTIRDVVGRLSLDELLSHQKRLESEIAQSIDSVARSWGLHVEAIRLEDIDVPEELKKMMSRQASSEREKRATIIKAEGDRQAADALAQAAATMAASPGAMQLRVLQTLDGLGPSASNTVVLAVPLEVIEVMRAYVRTKPPS
jgi:regulator of protease activity HflC (stomatin/prohibitin superfamily)